MGIEKKKILNCLSAAAFSLLFLSNVPSQIGFAEPLVWMPIQMEETNKQEQPTKSQVKQSQQPSQTKDAIAAVQQQQQQVLSIVSSLQQQQNPDQKNLINMLIGLIQQQQQMQLDQKKQIDNLTALLEKKEAAKPETPAPVTAIPSDLKITPLDNYSEVQNDFVQTRKPSPRIEIIPEDDVPIVRKTVREIINDNMQDAADAITKEAAICFSYSDGALYKIVCKEGFLTDIQLQPGEDILSISGGDTTRWMLDQAISGTGAYKQTHVNVKPLKGGLETNIIITTNKHIYHLYMRSANDYYPIVSWLYPQEQKSSFMKQSSFSQKQNDNDIVSLGDSSFDILNYDYKIQNKDYPWKPLRVVDNGVKTFIQLPKDVVFDEAPILLIKDGKKLSMVNHRIKNSVIVVDRLFDEAELKLRDKSIKIKKLVKQ